MSVEILEKAVLDCLAHHYGIRGRLERLPGENINYKVTTPAGKNYVLKLVDEHTPPEVVEMEVELLQHVNRTDFPLKLPQIIQTNNKKYETRIDIRNYGLYRLRLIEFLDGMNWEYIADISLDMVADAGSLLAEFNQVLGDFDHPGAHRDHRWNLAQSRQHLAAVERIEDRNERELVSWAFDRWLEVEDKLSVLPHQVIHGDANRGNFLVKDGLIVGLIDFGDSCYNPRICELAICLAYFMMDREDPFEVASVITAAYTDVIELSEAELDVLLPLVCGRLAVSVCVANERKAIDPDNPNWYDSLAPALKLLEQLREAGAGDTPAE